MDDSLYEVRRTYDTVAREYAHRISPELQYKPFDRSWLNRYAARIASRGPVWDLGCGPGHVARYLADRSVTIAGLDLSGALIRLARLTNPDIPFCLGDLRRLPVRGASLAGIVALYSIIHLARPELVDTVAEWRRALRRGGLLFLAAHLGAEDCRLQEWWGHTVDITFRFFEPSDLEDALVTAGFIVEEVRQRDPYPDIEAQTRRVYIFARNP